MLLLLQRDESGGLGSTDAEPTVLHGLVRDRELSQIVSNHLRLDLDLIELHKLLMGSCQGAGPDPRHGTVRELPEGPLLLQINCIGVICHNVFSCRSESSNISLVVLERT